jgi:hypothetical protein
MEVKDQDLVPENFQTIKAIEVCRAENEQKLATAHGQVRIVLMLDHSQPPA